MVGDAHGGDLGVAVGRVGDVAVVHGVDVLFAGEEFGENYFLPEFGAGRVALLRETAVPTITP